MRSESNPAGGSTRFRDVLLALAGVSGLLAGKWLPPAPGGLVHACLGNVTASFATYFVVRIAIAARSSRVAIALLALVVVEAFELTDGFGVMSNVYDPVDLLANVVGVAFALLIDIGLPVRSAPAGQR